MNKSEDGAKKKKAKLGRPRVPVLIDGQPVLDTGDDPRLVS
jgi:hypothetical protein